VVKRTRTWKQAYRNVPPHIAAQLAGLPPDEPIVVGCARTITIADVQAGVWSHTGITETDGVLAIPEGFLPPREIGRFSRWNIDGRKVPLRDRPKETVSFCHESPNFGDYAKGSHQVCFDREIWQKETRFAKSLEIALEGVGGQVAFKITEALVPSAPNFERDLLESINILQENVGCAEVHPAGADAAAFAGSIRVTWELLPVGTREEMVKAVEERVGRGGRPVPNTVRERIEAFHALGPRNIITGASGFSRYIGAQIEDDLVVLENPIHGNAVYILGSDWEEVSQRSRIDLLRDETAHYDRVVHRDGWQTRLRDIVDSRRR
jgi:hypothetical protein